MIKKQIKLITRALLCRMKRCESIALDTPDSLYESFTGKHSAVYEDLAFMHFAETIKKIFDIDIVWIVKNSLNKNIDLPSKSVIAIEYMSIIDSAKSAYFAKKNLADLILKYKKQIKFTTNIFNRERVMSQLFNLNHDHDDHEIDKDVAKEYAGMLFQLSKDLL